MNVKLLRQCYEKNYILNYLYFNEGISQSEFAKLLDLEKAQILYAKLCDKMEAVTKEVTRSFRPKKEVYTLRSTYNKDGSLSKFAREGDPIKY